MLRAKLEGSGFCVRDGYIRQAELLIVIGGDGTLLQAIHKYDFPDVPIIGINTGHLGFFQEIHPNDLDEFIFNYKNEKYSLQNLSTVQAIVTVDGKEIVHKGLNEIIIKGNHSYSTHLNISIGGSFIEKFSGDGILIATPSGSTAYNYSLGGSIVDPRIDLLQVTPIAPMNTTAYRSFTSSLLLPSDMKMGITPEYTKSDETYILSDGSETGYRDVEQIIVEYSDTIVKLMRFENYDFWNKVKTKFI
ncbi:MAG: NAD(+)/NADH kinase [Eubacteriaceae bacterium]|nr:NAD(+)/NADH kinase [Eubacteriaceae bacterium]